MFKPTGHWLVISYLENEMRLILEIRAAEGGDDAKALVAVQAAIYEAYALRQGLRTAKQAGHG